MTPFDYPSFTHTPRHGPSGYMSYSSFRHWIRDEFNYRCVYCLRRERWEPNSSLFELDHLVPESKSPNLKCEYLNLIYCCSICNLTKSGESIPNPLEWLRLDNIKTAIDGRAIAVTRQTRELIDILDLNSPSFVTWRYLLIELIELARVHDRVMFRTLLAYPEDLADLSLLRPPGGNSRPEGIRESAFARRERGELPEIY